MLKIVAVATVLLLTASVTYADDYYGRFDGSIRGNFVITPGQSRNLFVLDESFTFIDPNGLEWTVPAGEVTDGASIPNFAWSAIGASFSGPHLSAAVVHDYHCCTRHRNWSDTHNAFWRGLKVMGVSGVDASFMYWAVYLFGPDEWPTPRNPNPPAPCRSLSDDGRVIHHNYRFLSKEQRLIGLSKLIAMVRTFQTTNGEAMDVVHDRVIPTSGEEAIEHLNKIQKAVENRFDFPLEELGLFSTFEDGESLPMSDLSGWAQGQLEPLDAYMVEMAFEYTSADDAPPLAKHPDELDLETIPETLVSDE